MELAETDKMTYNAFLSDGLIQEGPVPQSQPISEASPQSKPFNRLPNGLIEGFEYKFKDGRINWEGLINPKYLIYPENDHTKQPLPKVDGLRDLAEIRGIASKSVKFQAVSEHLVIASVTIEFIPNNDDPKGRIWSAMADATPSNVGDKRFSKYLATIAETRATGRCIREALGIRLCSFEEVSSEDLETDENANLPIGDETIVAIQRQMEIKGINLEDLLNAAHKNPKNRNITSLNQLTIEQGRTTLRYLNEMKNAKSL